MAKTQQPTAPAKGNIAAPNPAMPFANGSNGQYVWHNYLWPVLRQGKTINMPFIVAAWQKAIIANPQWGVTGNTQNAQGRAKGVLQWVAKGVLAHVPGQRGVYTLGAKYNYTPKGAKAQPTAPTAQPTAPTAQPTAPTAPTAPAGQPTA